MRSTATKHKNSSKDEPGVAMMKNPAAAADERISYIATAAYYKAEARGFTPGQELEDWLEAEAKFNACEKY